MSSNTSVKNASRAHSRSIQNKTKTSTSKRQALGGTGGQPERKSALKKTFSKKSKISGKAMKFNTSEKDYSSPRNNLYSLNTRFESPSKEEDLNRILDKYKGKSRAEILNRSSSKGKSVRLLSNLSAQQKLNETKNSIKQRMSKRKNVRDNLRNFASAKGFELSPEEALSNAEINSNVISGHNFLKSLKGMSPLNSQATKIYLKKKKNSEHLREE